MRTPDNVAGCGGIALIASLVIGAAAVSYTAATWDERVQECTVTSKDRGGGSGSYRIYTEECGVLANKDSVWHTKWNSADVQASLEPGSTYELRVVGWRFGPTSTFPNVIAVEGEL